MQRDGGVAQLVLSALTEGTLTRAPGMQVIVGRVAMSDHVRDNARSTLMTLKL